MTEDQKPYLAPRRGRPVGEEMGRINLRLKETVIQTLEIMRQADRRRTLADVVRVIVETEVDRFLEENAEIVIQQQEGDER